MLLNFGDFGGFVIIPRYEEEASFNIRLCSVPNRHKTVSYNITVGVLGLRLSTSFKEMKDRRE